METHQVTAPPAKRARPLVSVDELEVRALRGQADAMRALAFQLHRAILAADWQAAAEVRSELAQIALGFDALAEDIETRRSKR